MNHQFKLLSTAILPLILSVACASTNQKLFVTEIATEETDMMADITNQQAIANMDGYLNRLEAETIQINTLEEALGVTENLIEKNAEDADTPLGIVVLGRDEINESEPEFLAPEKILFRFAFNKENPLDEDLKVLNDHAQYLIKNPNMLLNITGHADKRGNWDDNLRLSESRAKSVADILVSAGVNESQLRVDGMSDSVPLIAEENWSENRRVELMYQESMVASK